jgi:hypothetical protein
MLSVCFQILAHRHEAFVKLLTLGGTDPGLSNNIRPFCIHEYSDVWPLHPVFPCQIPLASSCVWHSQWLPCVWRRSQNREHGGSSCVCPSDLSPLSNAPVTHMNCADVSNGAHVCVRYDRKFIRVLSILLGDNPVGCNARAITPHVGHEEKHQKRACQLWSQLTELKVDELIHTAASEFIQRVPMQQKWYAYTCQV